MRTPALRGLAPANPTPSEIKEARLMCKYSIREAAISVHVATITWKNWENGTRPMHRAFSELFYYKCIKPYLESEKGFNDA
jgi:DNA-binding transcriptional regulator YiaG